MGDSVLSHPIRFCATAIEYAILAALIGLGLVGSARHHQGVPLERVRHHVEPDELLDGALRSCRICGRSSSGSSSTAPATINWKGRPSRLLA